MAIPKLYHPFRKWALRHILISTGVSFIAAEAFWRLHVVPKVERRNLVMKLIEEERIQKREAIEQAKAEIELPGQGSYDDLRAVA